MRCTAGQCVYGRLYVPSKLVPNSSLFFIAENPSFRELQLGTPLVGPAGKKFDSVLAQAGISRSEVSIGNLTCCCDTTRERKNPLPDEIDACWPRLMAEIEMINPQVVFLLGALPSAQFFVGATGAFGNIRGKPRVWQGHIALCSWHPARILPHRSPEAEPLLVEDLLLAKSLIQ